MYHRPWAALTRMPLPSTRTDGSSANDAIGIMSTSRLRLSSPSSSWDGIGSESCGTSALHERWGVDLGVVEVVRGGEGIGACHLRELRHVQLLVVGMRRPV